MVLTIYVQMAETTFAVQKLDSIVFVAHLDLTFAIQFNARAFVQAHVVVSQINSGVVIALKINPGRSFPVQMNGCLEVILPVVDLDAVPHRFGAAHCLDVHPNDLRFLGARVVIAHLDVRANRCAAMVAEDFGMNSGRPTGAVLVQSRTNSAGVAHFMVRIKAGVKRPWIGVLPLLLMDQRQHFVSHRFPVVFIAAFE